jgi:hypothetical protein
LLPWPSLRYAQNRIRKGKFRINKKRVKKYGDHGKRAKTFLAVGPWKKNERNIFVACPITETVYKRSLYIIAAANCVC